MAPDLEAAHQYLDRFNLKGLFIESLGWEPPGAPQTLTIRALRQSYRAHGVARRGETRVWEVRGVDQLSPDLKSRVYRAIHRRSPWPLIIFTQGDRRCSLWYCQHGQGDDRPASAVYVAQQPLAGWQARLAYLKQYDPAAGAISLRPDDIAVNQDAGGLRQLLTETGRHITGIGNPADRHQYSVLLVMRLIFIYGLQRRGLLNGDIWYLHNQLGRSQQQGGDRFFSQILLPLWRQGFSLPAVERPRDVGARLGQIPYLGNIFQSSVIEQQYDGIDIADAAFEAILLWLSAHESLTRVWSSNGLGPMLQAALSHGPARAVGLASCDRILSDFFLPGLGLSSTATQPDLWDVLYAGRVEHLRTLVQDILPHLSVLDPACGVANLLGSLVQRLVDIYSAILGQLCWCQDSQLQIWRQGFMAEHPSTMQTIYRRIFKQGVYGVDINATAVEVGRLHLLQILVELANSFQDIEPLPSLDFNLMVGNSLVGFCQVDEAGFDRIAASDSLLQGNLLQPLAAETYRTILAEKHITLEYYRSQGSLLAELQDIPAYAQLEFFRERLNRLDSQAQHRLNELLLDEFSQRLGIRFKEFQLTQRPSARLLTMNDIDVLQPFHWGYHFDRILRQQGGFKVVLSEPPQGTFRPSIQEFFLRFADLANETTLENFRTSKRALLRADPELAQAWLFYQSQYSFITDYFYRSSYYTHQSPMVQGQHRRTQLRLEWLYIERCFNLLAPGGVCGLMVPTDIMDSPRAIALRGLLEHRTTARFTDGCARDSNQSGEYCLLSFCRRSTAPA